MAMERPKRTYQRLADALHLSLQQVSSAVKLFDEGNTVPFVARYRQEATGCLSDTELRKLHSKLETLDAVEERRQSMFSSSLNPDALSDAARMEIDSAESIETLEELCAPYIKTEVSEATKARDSGLEVLARGLMEEGFEIEMVKGMELGMGMEKALEGARHIIAEDVSRIPAVKEAALKSLRERGRLVTTVTEEAQVRMLSCSKDTIPKKVATGRSLSLKANDPLTYEAYFKWSGSIPSIKPHQVLAINRAEHLGFLRIRFDWKLQDVFDTCLKIVQPSTGSFSSDSLNEMMPAVWHGIEDFVRPSTEAKVRSKLTEVAVSEATDTFTRNLLCLLMAPPLVGATVMGIDPGFKNGCKICICNDQGAVKETAVIYPNRMGNYKAQARSTMLDMITKNRVNAIALGDGVGSREMETFLHEVLKSAKLEIGWAIVSEDGASVYSASELASGELPQLHASLRGAVSIARRLQDPLAELVKVDPAHLGVGMYQLDIQSSLLSQHLKGVVESAVNTVGVDINTASPSLLSHVAGLSLPLAIEIHRYRERNGVFRNRLELYSVDNIDNNIFRQCAGFLRIRNGKNALDNTAVHPESYFVVHNMLESFFPDRMMEENVSLEDLERIQSVLWNMKRSGELKIEDLACAVDVGVPTLRDIVENILAPGRDVRGQSGSSRLKWSDRKSIEHLKIGDKIVGVVKNVVDFGAFVDINVGISGLLHVSQMGSGGDSYGNWNNPHDVCKVGDKLTVEVLNVDVEKQKIRLKLIEHELDL